MLHKFVMIDDKVLPREALQIPVTSASAQFGMSPFEGVRVYVRDDGVLQVIELERHISRLRESCARLCIACPLDLDVVLGRLSRLCEENYVSGDAAFRLMIVVDEEASWSADEVVGRIAIFGVNKARLTLRDRPRKVFGLSSVRRPSKNSMPFQVKVGANYINSRYGQIEALKSRVDNMLHEDEFGRVIEAGGANVVFVRRGGIICAPDDSNILRGITLETLKSIALRSDIEVTHEAIVRSEVSEMDAAFICGSAVEVNPIQIAGAVMAVESEVISVLHDKYMMDVCAPEPVFVTATPILT